MKHEVEEALNEIMDIPPIYRREYIVGYLRQNLSEGDARRYLFEKTKAGFIKKMIAEGFLSREDLLEKIGKERVRQYFHILSTMS